MMIQYLFLALAAYSSATTNAQEVLIGDLVDRSSHDVGGTVYALSERVMEIRGFTYDGLGPAGFWWADTNARPSDDGYILADAPTNCGMGALPAADGSMNYRVEFPEGTSILDIQGGSISVWCEAFSANFGDVVVPTVLEGVPTTSDGPALECSGPVAPVSNILDTPEGFNCEPLLNDLFQVRWAVVEDDLFVELVGVVEEDEYMAFGRSGSDNRTEMIGADVVIADMFGGGFRATDFYLSDRSQCSGGQGVCPDTASDAAAQSLVTDNVADVSGERSGGVTSIRYRRPLAGSDALDRAIAIDAPQSIAWAIGPVSPDTGLPQFHSQWLRDDVAIDFGRAVVDNCEPLPLDDDTGGPAVLAPFDVPAVTADATELVAHIGPSGGDRGYAGLTGRVSWGIAWYINDLLIPVIEMTRGTEYTFRVSGGDNPDSNAEFHPFYLTTGEFGGYAQLEPAERAAETILAGITITNETDAGVFGFESTVQAPICSYQVTGESAAASEGTFAEYFDSLDTSCQDDAAITDAAAVLTFTPDESTPDLIYYQCVTHRNLGWKIKVVDVDTSGAFSRGFYLAIAVFASLTLSLLFL